MKTKTLNRNLGTRLAQRAHALLTKRELADRLRKTEKTIERWQQLGRLPHLKIGHSILYPEGEVMAHLRSKYGRNLAT